ncbi:hypothetical protein AVEN_135027-1 [Araneus ventricosus]|uniref:Tc1-like transposase DDE domain-containing protein n=1 Tax=Araneus ventricosus TaxID=182803 RepID=A0A4Y2VXI7_ARAVE|nr:hypothetical protein AVEN_135027-1 [Araneus ventricosus]
MQDSAPPHIANPVKRLLSVHFEYDRIISSHFATHWPPRSPDLKPCDFWLWGYLKHVAFSGPIANLAELKTRNISTTSAQAHCDLLWNMLFLGLNLWQEKWTVY